jgi:hypothetical protein
MPCTYEAPGGMIVTMKSTGFASCPQNLCESVISVRVESGVASPAVAARHLASVLTKALAVDQMRSRLLRMTPPQADPMRASSATLLFGDL